MGFDNNLVYIIRRPENGILQNGKILFSDYHVECHELVQYAMLSSISEQNIAGKKNKNKQHIFNLISGMLKS